MNLGPLEIGIIVLLILVLFGYKKLPAASRSLGQSLRIFKGEMKGMKSDDVAAKDAATVTPPRGEITPRPSSDLTAAELQDEAREQRGRADSTGSVDGPR